MSDNVTAVVISAIAVVGLLVLVLTFYLPEILAAMTEWFDAFARRRK